MLKATHIDLDLGCSPIELCITQIHIVFKWHHNKILYREWVHQNKRSFCCGKHTQIDLKANCSLASNEKSVFPARDRSSDHMLFKWSRFYFLFLWSFAQNADLVKLLRNVTNNKQKKHNMFPGLVLHFTQDDAYWNVFAFLIINNMDSAKPQHPCTLQFSLIYLTHCIIKVTIL